MAMTLVKAAKRLLCYLKYSRELGLCFSKAIRNSYLSFVTAFMDASDADCVITRKSTGGHILFISLGPTVWKVGQSPVTTLSTAESELMQIAATVHNGRMSNTCMTFSKAAIQIAENACYRSKTKHMGRLYRFIRDAVENKKVILIYCPTEYNIVDIFTKPLGYERFVYLHGILLGYEGYLPDPDNLHVARR
eukprot:2058736-Rhodomonas_salina.1